MYQKFAPPQPSHFHVFKRVLAWFGVHWRFQLRLLSDRLRGKDDPGSQGRALREAFEQSGGAIVPVVQQIAMRLDVLPLEYATELAKIEDKGQAPELAYVVERVERAVGAPLHEVFESFDPKPIKTDTISGVYQGKLVSGEMVAVKVRRPDAALLLNAERLALDFLLRYLIRFAPGGAPIFEQARNELPQLLLESLDFVRVARLQSIFRREAKKAKLKSVTAARIYMKLSCEDVIVSEFVSGVWLEEVSAAQENQDRVALRQLEMLDIDPVKCGKHLLHAGWWTFFENIFLCQMPDTANIVVRPGNQLVFVNLGDTGILGARQRHLLAAALDRMAEHDVEGAVAMLVQLLLPLPRIDIHEFTKRVEWRIWSQLYAMDNRDMPWWERAGTGMWLGLLDTAQEYGVTIRLDVARMIQAFCMYDHIAGRLWPRLRVLKEYHRYRRKARKRAVRKLKKKSRKAGRGGGGGLLAGLMKSQELLNRISLIAERAVEELPLQYIALSKKSAYAMSQMLVALTAIAKLTIVMVTVKAALDYWVVRDVDVVHAFELVIAHPLFLVPILYIFVTTARRILFRLQDIDRTKSR